MTELIRGEQITFRSTFVDYAGAPFTPSAASVRVAYSAAGVKSLATLPMTIGGDGAGVAVWDSSVADPALVSWFIRATGGATVCVDEGAFGLSANAANPSP